LSVTPCSAQSFLVGDWSRSCAVSMVFNSGLGRMGLGVSLLTTALRLTFHTPGFSFFGLMASDFISG
jgi:hypothetical protein